MYFTFKNNFLAKDVKQTMSFEEPSETNDCRNSNLTILLEEDVNVVKETTEDRKYKFKSEPNAESNKRDYTEDFIDKTKCSNDEINFTKHLEANMNSPNNTIEDFNKNNTIEIESKMTENKAILEKDKTQRNVTSRSANTLFLLLRIVKSVPMLMNQWMVIFILLRCVCALKEQRFAIEPQDQVSFQDFYQYQWFFFYLSNVVTSSINVLSSKI